MFFYAWTLKNGHWQCTLGAFFVTVLGSSRGLPQPGPENGSELLAGSLFRNRFGLFPGPPPRQAPRMAQNCSWEQVCHKLHIRFRSWGSLQSPFCRELT